MQFLDLPGLELRRLHCCDLLQCMKIISALVSVSFYQFYNMCEVKQSIPRSIAIFKGSVLSVNFDEFLTAYKHPDNVKI